MKHILLIDDDKVGNFVNKKNLQLSGLVESIQVADNGRQGLEMFNDYYMSGNPLPDFIFVDINMPVMDGFEFLEAFNKLTFPNKDKIKIVMMSSSESDKDVLRAKKYGVVRYIFKPLVPKDIALLLIE